MASRSSSKDSSHMYSNSGGVTLLQYAPNAWLLWAVAPQGVCQPSHQVVGLYSMG